MVRYQIRHTDNPNHGFAARNVDQVRGMLAEHGVSHDADTSPLDHLGVLDAATVEGWRVQRIA
jgi:hypothetical protein